MTILTEGTHTAEFVASLANGDRSVDEVTLISGQNLLAGTVLGKITASGKYTEMLPGASDGSEVSAGVLWADSDATGGDLTVVAVLRDAEVNSLTSFEPSGTITGPELIAAKAELAAVGIIFRAGN